MESRTEQCLDSVSLRDLKRSKCGEVHALGDDEWRPLATEPSAAEKLSAGDGFFSFCCCGGSDICEDGQEIVRAVINVSQFDDETKENNVPRLEAADLEDYRVIVVKATYALPGVDPSKLTPELLSSIEYHEQCQPGPPKLETDMDLPKNTVRFVKSIVPWVFSITVQLAVSVMTDKAVLDQLAVVDGRRPTHAVLMERTKRDPSKTDSTVKCKSLLLYHRVDGGVVCTNVSVVVNTSVPGPVAKAVNTFGSSGADEVKHTMQHTRQYLLKKIGDTRRREGDPQENDEEEEETPGVVGKVTGAVAGWFGGGPARQKETQRSHEHPREQPQPQPQPQSRGFFGRMMGAFGGTTQPPEQHKDRSPDIAATSGESDTTSTADSASPATLPSQSQQSGSEESTSSGSSKAPTAKESAKAAMASLAGVPNIASAITAGAAQR